MNIKKYLSANLFGIFFTFCSAVLGGCALLRFAGISSPLAVCAFSFLFTAISSVVYFYRKNIVTYICIAVVLAAAPITLSATGIHFVNYVVSVSEKLLSGSTLDKGEAVLVCAVVSLVLSVLFYALSDIRVMHFAVAAAAVALLVIYGINSISGGFAELFSSVGIIVFVVVEINLLIKYKKEPSAKLKGVMSNLLPVVVIFSLIVALIPSPEEPISWQGVKNFISGIKEAAESMTYELNFILSPDLSEFGINMQGYNENGDSFSGAVIPNDRQEMNVSFYSVPRSSLYLIGTVNDTYSGDGWEKTKNRSFSENDYYLDYCETAYAIERVGYDEEELSKFVKRNSVNMVYDNIRTKTLFYPLKTYSVGDCDERSYNATYPSVLFKRTTKSGTKYKFSYLEINYRSEQFTELARNAEGFTGGEVFPSEFLGNKLPEGIAAELNERADYIREKYTDVPDCITPRTYALADEITSGCDCDYDKLVAIEAYLNDGYTYTCTPGAVPDGYDPVEYFLFESREGYCTYFASAMALLARCEGIPTRYVQGFMYDVNSEHGLMNRKILRSDAHAWTEAYIEGIGWIPFEPTASFGEARYKYTTAVPTSPKYEFTYEYDHTSASQYVPQDKPEEEKADVTPYVIAALISVLCIVIVIASYIGIRLTLYRLRYKKSSDTDKFIACYGIITYLSGKKGLVRAAGETADCFAKRVSEFYDSSDGVSFREITEVFDRIRYGGGNSQDDEREAAEKYLRRIIDVIKHRESSVKAAFLLVVYCLRKQS